MSDGPYYDVDDLLNRGKVIQGLIDSFGAVPLDSHPRKMGFTDNGKEKDDGQGTKQDDGER